MWRGRDINLDTKIKFCSACDVLSTILCACGCWTLAERDGLAGCMVRGCYSQCHWIQDGATPACGSRGVPLAVVWSYGPYPKETVPLEAIPWKTKTRPTEEFFESGHPTSAKWTWVGLYKRQRLQQGSRLCGGVSRIRQ